MISILLVAEMSQIRILTPDWSIAAVPCYFPEWKIAFGVNDETKPEFVAKLQVEITSF